MSDVTGQLAEDLDLPVDEGALMVDATDGGPADDAGLRGGDPPTGEGGDLLVTVDGEKISSADDVAAAIADNKPGDEIEVELYRGDEREQLKVELGKRPDQLETAPAPPDEGDDGNGLLP